MKAIMVMYDSLNREMLESYGCNWTKTPNFKRLAEKCVQFEQCYVGSMPCMPARRELQTGRINFFHRSWGPMEPFDDSMPEILKKGGVYTHLVSDHQHYLEDGGATYHNRYSSWEIARGQEGDNWKADVAHAYEKGAGTVFENKKVMLEYPLYARMMAQDRINRAEMNTEEKTSRQSLLQMAWNSSRETMAKTTGSCRLRPSIHMSRSILCRRIKSFTHIILKGMQRWKPTGHHMHRLWNLKIQLNMSDIIMQL